MIIRNAMLSDENNLIEICAETSGQTFNNFEEKKNFSQRWIIFYLHEYRNYCFVAEDDGEVIGYIASAPDTIAMEKSYIDKIKPKEFFKCQDELGEYLKDYPAHLHINLTSKCQGKGIGVKLMNVMEKNLIKNNVKGIHLGVMESKEHAIKFYKKLGFKELKMQYYAEGDPACVFMGKNLK
ncbi:MAG: GNAT family N-acetyltransferase [Spirochaetaceae bacterium]